MQHVSRIRRRLLTRAVFDAASHPQGREGGTAGEDQGVPPPDAGGPDLRIGMEGRFEGGGQAGRRRIREGAAPWDQWRRHSYGQEDPPVALRLLPSPPVAAVLVVVLTILAGWGILRMVLAGGTAPQDLAHAQSDTPARESDQADGDLGLMREDAGPVSAQSAAGPGQALRDEGAPAGTTTQVTVYVSGQVARPGVVVLPQGARVHQAVAAVGGLGPQADPSSVNMARILLDGEHVLVAALGQASPPADGGPGAGGGADAAACVDLRTADATTLETLDGVGPALAGRIIAHRKRGAPLDSLADLDAVPGIGPALLARIGAGTCQK
ncbi:ComEA family DNA-binding protein [Schaalia sp. 19OD2882]|uniref:ComEA family DNA-binding protein n=1 Tax=Schaalia sp. 19OD2882 TaxID=2794089 RepID=UPI001C1E8E02|nr:ComEA family DNA-binding protein [Schaalia sp. 19OD2882]QWW19048.1 ComEA family DNA-binding protein [Schaalia sp. 19OD2882]